jgi:hypothetical protein
LTGLVDNHDPIFDQRKMMLRRSLLIAGLGLVPALGIAQKARSSEAHAAVPKTNPAGAAETERAQIEALLAKNGYRFVGYLRSKGRLISTTAERDGVAWKLVFDRTSGEIVGRRLLITPATLNN